MNSQFIAPWLRFRAHAAAAVIAVGALSLAMVPGALAANYIVNDTFDVGAAPTLGNDADDPLDVAWSTFSGSSTLASPPPAGPGSGNYLQTSTTQDFIRVLGNLPNGDPRLILGVGDTLILSMDFAYSENAPDVGQGLRIGLVDANNLGYIATMGTGSDTTAQLFRDQLTTNQAGGGGWPANMTGPAVSGTMLSGIQEGTDHTFRMQFTRVDADTMQVNAWLNGALLEGFDSTGQHFDFNDGLIVVRHGALSSNFRLDNVMLLTPEPGRSVLLAGGLLLLLARRRR